MNRPRTTREPARAGVTLTRRAALTVAAGSATALGLAACGGPASGSPGAGDQAPTGSSGGGGPARPLVALADVPVGGAVSATSPDGRPIIVAQPTAGTAVGFSAICTHMGCTVTPAGKQLDCPCHGSVFDAATGKNLSGPAPRPLPPYTVHVSNGQVLSGA